MKIIYVKDIPQNKSLISANYIMVNSVFWQVMVFYALLSCVIAPLIGQHFRGSAGLGEGYIVGSVVSVLLWLVVGKKYAKM